MCFQRTTAGNTLRGRPSFSDVRGTLMGGPYHQGHLRSRKWPPETCPSATTTPAHHAPPGSHLPRRRMHKSRAPPSWRRGRHGQVERSPKEWPENPENSHQKPSLSWWIDTGETCWLLVLILALQGFRKLSVSRESCWSARPPGGVGSSSAGNARPAGGRWSWKIVMVRGGFSARTLRPSCMKACWSH